MDRTGVLQEKNVMHLSPPDLKISYLMVRTEMQYFHIRFNMRAFPAWLLDEGLQNKVG
ncbi:hypothetical protein PO909_020410 [Leuciscus waleckii]